MDGGRKEPIRSLRPYRFGRGLLLSIFKTSQNIYCISMSYKGALKISALNSWIG